MDFNLLRETWKVKVGNEVTGINQEHDL